MIKLKYILFAKSTMVDQRNQLTVSQITESIEAQALPANYLESSFVVTFERDVQKDPEIKQGYEIILHLNKTKIGSSQFDLDFKGKKINRIIMDIPVLTLTEIGTLKFEVCFGNKVLGEYTVEVIKSQKSLTA
jgi:hypothetical protein